VDAGHNALLRFDLSTLPPSTTSEQIQQATLTVLVAKIPRAGAVSLALIDGAWSETETPAVGSMSPHS